jgi:hypothetical protein
MDEAPEGNQPVSLDAIMAFNGKLIPIHLAWQIR